MATELRIETRALETGRTVVTCRGEVDVTNVARLRAALEDASDPEAGRAVVADLDGLTYFDSAGVEVLFSMAHRQPLEVVAGPGCVVRRVIDVVGLAQVAKVRDGPDEP